MINIINLCEAWDDSAAPSMLLVGPRDEDKAKTWQERSLSHLQSLRFEGTVFIPTPLLGMCPFNMFAAKRWVRKCAKRSNAIALWIPDDLKTMPAFSIRKYLPVLSGKIVLGYPSTALNMQEIDRIALANRIPTETSLYRMIKSAVKIAHQ